MGDSSIPNRNKKSDDGRFYIDSIKTASDAIVTVKVPIKSVNDKELFAEVMDNICDFADDKEALVSQIERLCESESDFEEVADSWELLRSERLTLAQ